MVVAVACGGARRRTCGLHAHLTGHTAHRRGTAGGRRPWYGPGFHGKRTANGEVYDQYELTAAYQTLPLGTRVSGDEPHERPLGRGADQRSWAVHRRPHRRPVVCRRERAAHGRTRHDAGSARGPDAPVQVASRTTVPVTTTPPASRRSPEPMRRDVEVVRRDIESRGATSRSCGASRSRAARRRARRTSPTPRSHGALPRSRPAAMPSSSRAQRPRHGRAPPEPHRDQACRRAREPARCRRRALLPRAHRTVPSRGTALAQAALVNRYGYPASSPTSRVLDAGGLSSRRWSRRRVRSRRAVVRQVRSPRFRTVGRAHAGGVRGLRFTAEVPGRSSTTPRSRRCSTASSRASSRPATSTT